MCQFSKFKLLLTARCYCIPFTIMYFFLTSKWYSPMDTLFSITDTRTLSLYICGAPCLSEASNKHKKTKKQLLFGHVFFHFLWFLAHLQIPEGEEKPSSLLDKLSTMVASFVVLPGLVVIPLWSSSWSQFHLFFFSIYHFFLLVSLFILEDFNPKSMRHKIPFHLATHIRLVFPPNGNINAPHLPHNKIGLFQ